MTSMHYIVSEIDDIKNPLAVALKGLGIQLDRNKEFQTIAGDICKGKFSDIKLPTYVACVEAGGINTEEITEGLKELKFVVPDVFVTCDTTLFGWCNQTIISVEGTADFDEIRDTLSSVIYEEESDGVSVSTRPVTAEDLLIYWYLRLERDFRLKAEDQENGVTDSIAAIDQAIDIHISSFMRPLALRHLVPQDKKFTLEPNITLKFSHRE